MLYNFAPEYTIRRFHVNQDGRVQTIKKNKEALVVAGEEIG